MLHRGHSPHRPARHFAVAAAALLAVGGLAACGDDEPSAQEKYCEAGEELRSSFDALLAVDIAGGVSAVSEALDEIRADVTELQDAATEAAADEVEALGTAINGIGDALSGLGDELSAENVQAVGTAISEAATAADAVYATLTDC